jgi:hypothetical protein
MDNNIYFIHLRKKNKKVLEKISDKFLKKLVNKQNNSCESDYTELYSYLNKWFNYNNYSHVYTVAYVINEKIENDDDTITLKGILGGTIWTTPNGYNEYYEIMRSSYNTDIIKMRWENLNENEKWVFKDRCKHKTYNKRYQNFIAESRLYLSGIKFNITGKTRRVRDSAITDIFLKLGYDNGYDREYIKKTIPNEIMDELKSFLKKKEFGVITGKNIDHVYNNKYNFVKYEQKSVNEDLNKKNNTSSDDSSDDNEEYEYTVTDDDELCVI